MKNKTHQKRVAAIHDLSGFGKCSLTVALPILSAAGIETSALPTAILSTHTGGISGYTYRDLTEDMRPVMKHWKSLDIKFDAIYTGFLGSFEQLDIVKEFFDAFRQEDNLILVDPVMGDNGEPYHPGPYTHAYIESLLRKLGALGPQKVVLTGVYFKEDELGAATYDRTTDTIDYVFTQKIPGYYHGTGDVFASALLSALLNDFSLIDAAAIAVHFTTDSIRRTYKAKTDYRFGVNFEQSFPDFLKELKLV